MSLSKMQISFALTYFNYKNTKGREACKQNRATDVMPEVLSNLSRWYGVRFTVTDSALTRRRLSADWENRSLESVLKSLSFALHAQVVGEGREIRLSIKRE